MIAITRDRAHRLPPEPPDRARPGGALPPLHLEDLAQEDGASDGILCRASLHHVVDEEAGLAQCFRLLTPGGVLGSSEGAWMPGHRGRRAGADRWAG